MHYMDDYKIMVGHLLLYKKQGVTSDNAVLTLVPLLVHRCHRWLQDLYLTMLVALYIDTLVTQLDTSDTGLLTFVPQLAHRYRRW